MEAAQSKLKNMIKDLQGQVEELEEEKEQFQQTVDDYEKLKKKVGVVGCGA